MTVREMRDLASDDLAALNGTAKEMAIYTSAIGWLAEIAIQLAVMNEREAECFQQMINQQLAATTQQPISVTNFSDPSTPRLITSDHGHR